MGWVVLKDSWPHLWWQQWSGRELPGTQDPCPAARGLSPGHTGQLGGAGIYLRGQLSSRERPRLRPPPPPRWLGFGAGATCLLRGPPGPLSSSRQEPTLEHRHRCFPHFLACSPYLLLLPDKPPAPKSWPLVCFAGDSTLRQAASFLRVDSHLSAVGDAPSASGVVLGLDFVPLCLTSSSGRLLAELPQRITGEAGRISPPISQASTLRL